MGIHRAPGNSSVFITMNINTDVSFFFSDVCHDCLQKRISSESDAQYDFKEATVFIKKISKDDENELALSVSAEQVI